MLEGSARARVDAVVSTSPRPTAQRIGQVVEVQPFGPTEPVIRVFVRCDDLACRAGEVVVRLWLLSGGTQRAGPTRRCVPMDATAGSGQISLSCGRGKSADTA